MGLVGERVLGARDASNVEGTGVGAARKAEVELVATDTWSWSVDAAMCPKLEGEKTLKDGSVVAPVLDELSEVGRVKELLGRVAKSPSE